MNGRNLGVIAAVLGVAVVAVAAQQPPASQQPAAPVAQQPSDIALVISGGSAGTPPRYAVPDFVALTPDAADIARTVGQVLWDDLSFEREFYMIPRDVMKTVAVARSPEQIPFDSWRELGADAVVFGTVERKGNTVTVQVRLYNVKSRQAVFSKAYDGPIGNPRLFAHTASDEIHLQQRNLKGVARTKLAFISDRTRESVRGTVEKRDVHEVWISDYDGFNQRRITVSRDLNLNPTWSPDGRALAYASYRRNGIPDIYVSRIYEGILQNPTKGVGNNYLPAYSPDGRQIAFASNRDGNFEIYVINVDGSGLRRVTNHPAYEGAPTWSPSGQQLAFYSDRLGKPQIFISNIDGSGVRRISVNESHADRPSWSPAPCNEIAFTAQTGPGFDIKVYDLATGETRQLTHSEGTNESPSYSANCRHITFQTTRWGRQQVATMTRDGRDVRQVTREGNNRGPAWSSFVQ